MARNYNRNRKNNKSRKQFQTLFIIIAILTAGCIWAARGYISTKETERTSTLNQSAEDLQMVSIPSKLPSKVKKYEGFIVDFNASNRTPNYVSWELLASETDGPYSRNGEKFWQDEDIKNCPRTSDYTRSGYDRGHMFPAADAKWSKEAMYQCFSMANITPQVHALNAGAWKTLEEKERLWAKRDSAIIIISGPIYQEADNLRIGDAGVRVPSAYFKVLFAPYVENPRAIAFVYPNEHCPGNMQNYSTSVDYVEELTGFDFFATLPDDIENKIESTFSFKEWNKR